MRCSEQRGQGGAYSGRRRQRGTALESVSRGISTQAPASPHTNQQQESADRELRVLGDGRVVRRGSGSLPDVKQRRRHGEFGAIDLRVLVERACGIAWCPQRATPGSTWPVHGFRRRARLPTFTSRAGRQERVRDRDRRNAAMGASNDEGTCIFCLSCMPCLSTSNWRPAARHAVARQRPPTPDTGLCVKLTPETAHFPAGTVPVVPVARHTTEDLLKTSGQPFAFKLARNPPHPTQSSPSMPHPALPAVSWQTTY